MADLMLNFDISGMEVGASVHLLEFLRVFLCVHYMEPSPVFKVYMFTWIGGRIIIQQIHVCFWYEECFCGLLMAIFQCSINAADVFIIVHKRSRGMLAMTGQASYWWQQRKSSSSECFYWLEFNCVALNYSLNYQNNLISANWLWPCIDPIYPSHPHLPDVLPIQ